MEFGFKKTEKKIVRPASVFAFGGRTSSVKDPVQSAKVIESVRFVQVQICEKCKFVFKDSECLRVHKEKCVGIRK